MSDAAALPDIRIVLVRPRNSGNVGSVVRICANFGFPPPRVVDMFQFVEDEARLMAAGCEAFVDEIEFYPDLDAALADRTFVAGTTALKRSKFRLEPLRQAVGDFGDRWHGAAVLFGNEKSGLTEEELTRCERLVTIPTLEYRSLNLSHAVGIVAWEIAQQVAPTRPQQLPEFAPREVVEPMFDQMFEALDAISFLHSGETDRIRILLRQLFSRNGLTRSDVQILRGIWHQVLWLAGQKK